jgi:hypothetical protein
VPRLSKGSHSARARSVRIHAVGDVGVTLNCAAQGSVIQAGNSARAVGLLGDKMDAAAMLQPARHHNAFRTRMLRYWIRTSKGCSWAVCRRLEGQHQRVRARCTSSLDADPVDDQNDFTEGAIGRIAPCLEIA